MHPYGLNLDEWIKWWPNGSLFSRLRFFEGTQLSPHFQRRAELAKMHVFGWALASNRPGYLLKKLQPRFASCPEQDAVISALSEFRRPPWFCL